MKGYLSTIIVGGLLISALFGYNLTPYTYNDYLKICHEVAPATKDFNPCMRPYYDQQTTANLVIIFSLTASAAATIILLALTLNKKFRKVI